MWHEQLPACTDASDLLVCASVKKYDIKGFVSASVYSQCMLPVLSDTLHM